LKIKNKLILFALFSVLFAAPAFADFAEDLMNFTSMDKSLLPMKEINFKAGVDFSGLVESNKNIGQDGVSDFTAGDNVSFAAEYFMYFNEYVAAGAGLSAENLRPIDSFPGKFGFAPLYVGVKVRSWPQEPGMYGYVVGQAGYGFMYGNTSFTDSLQIKNGGFYYAFGLGIVYKYVILEALYGFNYGTLEDKTSGNKTEITYSRWTISIGYKI